jgi:hypothetical protein
VSDETLPEDAMLGEEAKADAAAPVAELNYQLRKPWKPGCIGFIVNNAGPPVAFLKWPKRRSKKDKA